MKINVTAKQWSVLFDILFAAKECLLWDDEMQMYVDGGRFILSLTKEEYEVLRSIEL